MAKIELLLPAMGEGIIEATITRWLIKAGDPVDEDQPLLEIATDKVDSEIPSPVKGIVARILKEEGDVAAVGDILAVIDSTATEGRPGPEEVSREVERITAKREIEDPESMALTGGAAGNGNIHIEPEDMHEIPRQTPSGKFLSPLVRSIARKENITPGELDAISGSGESGRINKDDILAYIASRKETETVPEPAGETAEIPEYTAKTAEGATKAHSDTAETFQDAAGTGPVVASESPGPAPAGEDRRIEMDRVRKLIAEHMVSSKQVSAHVTSFIDTDVSGVVKWREANKDEFYRRENQKLTFTPVFIEAAAKALRDFPMVNISVEGTTIIVRKSVNIGIAVALPEGNLIVPVIKNADEKNLAGLAKSVNDLAHRARSKKLKPDEITGGTFTITNFGTFGNTAGTPIINQPEVAILGTGAIAKKPVVLETGDGEVIAIRHIMTLSLTYDHRVIDGALGGMFLQRIAQYLEDFDTMVKI